MASSVAQINLDEKRENRIVVATGANLELRRADIDNAGNQISQAEILLMQLGFLLIRLFM